MSERSFEDQMEAIDSLQTNLARFMQSAGLNEVVIEVQCVGTRAAARTRARGAGGEWQENTVPSEIIQESVRLRGPMAHPKGGAWTWASLSMRSGDYQLASDFDYDHQPQLTPPITPADCAEELRLFPRDPRATPAWLAQS